MSEFDEEIPMGEEPPLEKITIEQMDEHVRKMFELKDHIRAKEAETKELNKQLSRMQMQAIAILKDLNRKAYPSPHGSVGITEKWSVPTPKTEEDKRAFFAYLKEKGMLYAYATVNSNSLQAFYATEKELAENEGRGMEFRIPGIGESKLFETCRMTKAK